MLPSFPVFPKQENVSQYLSDDINYNGQNLTKSKHLRGEDKVLSDSIIGSKRVQRQAHVPKRHPVRGCPSNWIQNSNTKINCCPPTANKQQTKIIYYMCLRLWHIEK